MSIFCVKKMLFIIQFIKESFIHNFILKNLKFQYLIDDITIDKTLQAM